MSKFLNKSLARALHRMSLGEVLKASEITDKKTLQHFIRDGIVQKMPAGGRRYHYKVSDSEALSAYLNLNYQIHSLENYLDLLEQEEVSGEEALQSTYSTKTRRSAVMKGFFIDSIQSVKISYGADQLSLPATGDTGIFLFTPEKLKPDEHFTIVGVENPEVFRKIKRLASYFEKYQPCVFVLRYMSKGLVSWLQQIHNPYLHFGDFDPAGLALYVNEYRKHLHQERCGFFIPHNIEKTVEQHGNRELYEKQYQHTRKMEFSAYPEIEELASILQTNRKGLEQEFLLRQKY